MESELAAAEETKSQEQAIQISIVKESSELKARLNKIRSNFKELTSLSALYGQSLKSVNELVQSIDEFAVNLASFEQILENEPVLEVNNINQMKTEMDVVSVSETFEIY